MICIACVNINIFNRLRYYLGIISIFIFLTWLNDDAFFNLFFKMLFWFLCSFRYCFDLFLLFFLFLFLFIFITMLLALLVLVYWYDINLLFTPWARYDCNHFLPSFSAWVQTGVTLYPKQLLILPFLSDYHLSSLAFLNLLLFLDLCLNPHFLHFLSFCGKLGLYFLCYFEDWLRRFLQFLIRRCNWLLKLLQSHLL